MVKKCDFLKVVKLPYPKIRFLVSLGSFFSTYEFFPWRKWLFAVSIVQEKCFNEKMGSLAALKKKLIIFPQKYQFWPFLTTYVHLQSRFSQRKGKISKNLWNIC